MQSFIFSSDYCEAGQIREYKVGRASNIFEDSKK